MELWVVILTVAVIALVVVLINSHLDNLQNETTIRKQEDLLLAKDFKIKEGQLAFEFLKTVTLASQVRQIKRLPQHRNKR